MKISNIVAVGALMCLLGTPVAILGENADPLSVLRGFFAAEDANDVDAALAYWADDGMFVGSRGQKRIGREQLRTQLIQPAIKARVHHEMKSPRVEGERVFWTEDESTDFYQKLGIKSVQNISEALVQAGKIKTLVVYFPLIEIRRIRQACDTPQAEGLSMFGLTCTEFVRLAQAHTQSMARK